MTTPDQVGVEGLCIPILGMHRSGTSALTLMLGHLGAAMPAAADLGYGSRTNDFNARGFWEPRLLVIENEAILRRHGGSWRVPPDLSSHELREHAGRPSAYQRMLIRYHSPGTTWVWKDPRLCLTLAFWDQLLDSRSLILMFRDPAAVALSLVRRNRMPLDLGYALWECYVVNSLIQAADRPALVVINADLVSRPEIVARRLLDWITPLGVTGKAEVDRAVRSVDPSLTTDMGGSKQDLPPTVASLWERVCDLPAQSSQLGIQPPAISEWAREVISETRSFAKLGKAKRTRLARAWIAELVKGTFRRGSWRSMDRTFSE
jgi:hypothetical protein